ncbi:MAG: selenium cofactor biosynthesis protein YqeC [Acidimicrobiales bacterium]|nr:selenium cofactor biosynthesis protein YqeC [Acidimicrobiales bacterium]
MRLVDDMAHVIELGQAASGAGCRDHELVSFVGGGGKTTLMHAFTRELGGRCIATTTTKMDAGHNGDLTTLIEATDQEIVAATRSGPALVWRTVSGGKALGVEPTRCDLLFDMVDYVLVVADEARSLPFKAPGTFEPVVPSATTMMVSVIGADALGRVIADQCHRPLRVAALAQCQPYERLTPKAAAAVLLHPNGQRAALPERARLVVAITKVEATNAGFVEELRGELARLEPAVTALSLAVSG